MGGGGHHGWLPYFSSNGAWVPKPRNTFSNYFVYGAGTLVAGAFAWQFSAERELRNRYPNQWIPSMLWSKEFHDPAFQAFWKEQLKKEGREWIEPIPDSMKSWWPLYRKQE
ncbi:hypothetical protein DFJ73DRAFT_867315 [Zopfochytrium polystomum]|nr:hypothetical protein DFJ73DRAFT_867315 [Zopfochytrium polystomum]